MRARSCALMQCTKNFLILMVLWKWLYNQAFKLCLYPKNKTITYSFKRLPTLNLKVVKNLHANSGDLRDVGSIPG